MTADQEKLLAQLTARYQKIADDATADAKAVDAIAVQVGGMNGWVISSYLETVHKAAERVVIISREAL